MNTEKYLSPVIYKKRLLELIFSLNQMPQYRINSHGAYGGALTTSGAWSVGDTTTGSSFSMGGAIGVAYNPSPVLNSGISYQNHVNIATNPYTDLAELHSLVFAKEVEVLAKGAFSQDPVKVKLTICNKVETERDGIKGLILQELSWNEALYIMKKNRSAYLVDPNEKIREVGKFLGEYE